MAIPQIRKQGKAWRYTRQDAMPFSPAKILSFQRAQQLAETTGNEAGQGRPYNGIEEVVGSIPSGSTITSVLKSFNSSALSADQVNEAH
jgi:hypothetical protein